MSGYNNLFDLLGDADDPETVAARAQQAKKLPQQQQAAKKHAGPSGYSAAGAGAAPAGQRRVGVQSAGAPSGSAPLRTSSSGSGANSRVFDYYRAFQKVFVDRATGEVVLRFHKTDVVRIRPNGDVLLTAGGYFTQTTLLSMNDALGAMGMALDAGGGGGVHTGNWTLRFDDGSACAYKDGMVVRSRGPGDAGRARAVLEAYSGAPVPAGVLPVAAPQPVPRPAAVPQQARQAPQPRVSGGAGAGAPSWAGASMPPGSAQGGPTGASLLTQQPQHHQQQHQPHAVAAQQRYGAAGPADSRGHHGHAPRAGDPAAVARQLAAAAERAGMHDDDLDDDEACVVCLAAARDTVLVPCGHVVLCSDCCEDVKAGSNECPMCRNSIAESIQMG